MAMRSQEMQFHLERNCGWSEEVVVGTICDELVGIGVGEKEVDDIGLGEIVTMGVAVGMMAGVVVGTEAGVGAKQEPIVSPWSR